MQVEAAMPEQSLVGLGGLVGGVVVHELRRHGHNPDSRSAWGLSVSVLEMTFGRASPTCLAVRAVPGFEVMALKTSSPQSV